MERTAQIDSREEDNGPATSFSTKTAAPSVTGSLKAHVPGEILIQFTSAADANLRGAALASVGGHAAEVLRGHLPSQASEGMLVRVKVGGGLTVEQALEAVSKLPGVRFAEPNFIYTTDAVTTNDPIYSDAKLWGMYGDQTNPSNKYGSQAGEAWSLTTGSPKVVVGVVDSGIDYTHPDLYLNVWLNQREIPQSFRASLTDVDADGVISFRDLNASQNASFVTDLNQNGRIDAGDLLSDSRWENGVDDDGNGYIDDLIGWDFVNNDNDPMDDNDHGTHVFGTIAAQGNNSLGVAGVTWSTQVMGLKFLSATGSGSLSNAILALDYYTAATTSSAQNYAATNNSWGGGGFSQSLLDAIVRGAKADVLFVAAAGNGGFDGNGDDNDTTANYPSNYDTTAGAGYDAVIAVASITRTGALSSFSNFGDVTVDLGAPGSGIFSTVPGGGYASFSGTSMATPHVTGAIALLSATSLGLTAAQLKAQLLATVTPTDSLAGKTVTGGRLDAATLVGVTTTVVLNEVQGKTGSDTVSGTIGNDKIWGMPNSGSDLGKGAIDTLIGSTGADIFVLGDERGMFYNDGKARSAGTSDYAIIEDFSRAEGDKIQIRGSLQSYHLVSRDGSTSIYHDTNGDGKLDSRDELIALVKNTTSLTSDDFLFVG
ncbi:MAG: S8 family serine peptidase [Pseudomonadota bacterium]|nr:S8 family serine peptidase [Pseudomonadota bacterium]